MPSRACWIALGAALALPAGPVMAQGEGSGEEAPLGLPAVPIPEDNPQTPAKIALGDKLFHEKRFSADGTIACSSCHEEEKAFTDGLALAEGIDDKKGTRNTPTVVNAAYYETQFWDGRRDSLETQALDPLVNPVEHGLESHDKVLEVVRNDPEYLEQFKEVFGVSADQITMDHVTKAIASFERTQVSGNSPFDRYLYGGEEDAISESAKRGLKVFRNKGRCVDCHTIEQSFATFTDNEFHNLGVGFDRIEDNMYELVARFRESKKGDGEDIDVSILTDEAVSELGRYTVTLSPQDVGRFKTSTIRNIAVTAPYMHDGSEKTLMDVVEFYDKGGNDNPLLDGGIRELNLTEQEKKDLVAFMRTLTSPRFADDSADEQESTKTDEMEE